MVHQILDCEITCRRVVCYKRIAVERERSFCRGEDAAKISFLLVQHLLHFLAHNWMRDPRVAARHLPAVLMSRVVLEVQEFLQRVSEAGTRPREHVREVGETCYAVFE